MGELTVGKQLFTWLTEGCEINASDAKLYTHAFQQLGIDAPKDLQMIDGDDDVAWPSIVKPLHRKKIQARLETDETSRETPRDSFVSGKV